MHGAADADRDYATRVSDYFFAFASTGTPSAPGGPAWPNHDLKQDRMMNFAETMTVETTFMRTRLNVLIDVSRGLNWASSWWR